MSIKLKTYRGNVEEDLGANNSTHIHMPKGEQNPAYIDEASNSSNGGLDKPGLPDTPPPSYSEQPTNAFYTGVYKLQTFPKTFYTTHRRAVLICIAAVLVALYFAYFSYAVFYGRKHFNEGLVRLIWVTCVVMVIVKLYILWKLFGERVIERLTPCLEVCNAHGTVISWVSVSILLLFSVVFILVDIFLLTKSPYNLVSASGLIAYILFCFIFSHNPARVRWRPVVWGLVLQILFGILILKWQVGFDAFKWLGDRVSEFLTHTEESSIFLFGENFRVHFFAFSVLPVIVFFSTVISILYYIGIMQKVVYMVAVVMQVCMGTTAGESLNASGNIFIGQTEAPLMIAPLLPSMTRSELHAVMTGGFATIAGSVLAAYIDFGVPANHLISASVMSAPAALAIAKLFYPETEKSKTNFSDVATMEKSKDRSLVEAITSGASQSISLIANIMVNLIAFLALLSFVNGTLTWLGNRVGVEELTLQLIFSYLLWPFSIMMGVDVADCRKVAEMLGNKTFLNEFIAYRGLGNIIKNKVTFDAHVALNGSWVASGDDIILQGTGPFMNATTTLYKGIISARSTVIATYALCGFANLGSIGIQLGGLGALAPSRKLDMTAVAVRAMIAGNIACFMTACIAGLLYQESVES